MDSTIPDQQQLWCVAKNNADDSSLQSAIDWACGPGGADCRPIQLGGPCYSQDLQSVASYAFNDYFAKHGFDLAACDFSGSAAAIYLDPSHDKCIFAASSSSRDGNTRGSSVGSIAGLDSSGSHLSISVCLHSKNWLLMLFFPLVVVFT